MKKLNKRALVINCSKGMYNLGQQKLDGYLNDRGYQVELFSGDPGIFAYGYDLVALSVIFSWDAPTAREIALRVEANSDVWCGGPGIFSLKTWWEKETGLSCQVGLDQRFERQRGDFKMTFASRGCPIDCWWCIVPRLEGTEFTLDWEFSPTKILCDNNLFGLPVDFQEHIIRRYQESQIALLDANSGFEPLSFDEKTYYRWQNILKGPWRFAYDALSEVVQVSRMMQILRKESARSKRVYVLIGNEPIAACYERAMKVIEWGGEPFCQPLIPHRLKIAHDWSYLQFKDFARYINRFIWRKVSLAEYSNCKGEQPLFANTPQYHLRCGRILRRGIRISLFSYGIGYWFYLVALMAMRIINYLKNRFTESTQA